MFTRALKRSILVSSAPVEAYSGCIEENDAFPSLGTGLTWDDVYAKLVVRP